MRGWKGWVSGGEGLGSGLGGVQKLRCSQQSKACGWPGGGTTSPGGRLGLVGVLPVRAFGWGWGGVGGLEKLRCSQQSKAFGSSCGVTTSPDLRLGLVGVTTSPGLRLGWVAGWVGVEKLRCSQQSKAFGWADWVTTSSGGSAGAGSLVGWGPKSCDARSSPKPSAGLGSGLGGVEKAAMLAAVQSLRLG
jgi:hypothetical protein